MSLILLLSAFGLIAIGVTAIATGAVLGAVSLVERMIGGRDA